MTYRMYLYMTSIALLILGLPIVGYIVFKDISHPVAYVGVISYVIMLALFLFFSFILFMKRLKHISAEDTKKIIKQFIILFILLSVVNIMITYLFSDEKVHFLKHLIMPFAISAGLTFYEIFSLQENK
ncbi:putative membrane protein YadS [Cerasibacillus quisquiliarum]|uniref:Uncharacterized protein n=1 Tax=Cerasibacillus quisquiliarum TaxID=227865 RepID=A0A511UXL0_9BACI|nr:hypothetical protein [Cerasibacillus quisquiliarum]MBB5146661.1 putative membrane protein YadS [Cerasibacillus quisquiliarum]GEN31359.1 hypothetical protein CQU01_15970 [Cerasibacillus quisquiliarum]